VEVQSLQMPENIFPRIKQVFSHFVRPNRCGSYGRDADDVRALNE
jgi:hypothetical protein